MKLSEWKKQYDKNNKNHEIRVINVEELLSISEFDDQPERSKREDLDFEEDVIIKGPGVIKNKKITSKGKVMITI